MIQTEDEDEKEQRVLLDDSGVATLTLPAGTYTFVWAVKMTPVQRHRYSMKAERIPDEGGDPVELRKRPNEQTTTGRRGRRLRRLQALIGSCVASFVSDEDVYAPVQSVLGFVVIILVALHAICLAQQAAPAQPIRPFPTWQGVVKSLQEPEGRANKRQTQRDPLVRSV